MTPVYPLLTGRRWCLSLKQALLSLPRAAGLIALDTLCLSLSARAFISAGGGGVCGANKGRGLGGGYGGLHVRLSHTRDAGRRGGESALCVCARLCMLWVFDRKQGSKIIHRLGLEQLHPLGTCNLATVIPSCSSLADVLRRTNLDT